MKPAIKDPSKQKVSTNFLLNDSVSEQNPHKTHRVFSAELQTDCLPASPSKNLCAVEKSSSCLNSKHCVMWRSQAKHSTSIGTRGSLRSSEFVVADFQKHQFWGSSFGWITSQRSTTVEQWITFITTDITGFLDCVGDLNSHLWRHSSALSSFVWPIRQPLFFPECSLRVLALSLDVFIKLVKFLCSYAKPWFQLCCLHPMPFSCLVTEYEEYEHLLK